MYKERLQLHGLQSYLYELSQVQKHEIEDSKKSNR